MPFTNNTDVFCVVIHYDILNNVIFIIDRAGIAIARSAVVSVNVAQPSLTAGSGTGTTDNQNGQVYTFGSNWNNQLFGFPSPLLLPPGFKIQRTGSGTVTIGIIQCNESLDDAVKLL